MGGFKRLIDSLAYHFYSIWLFTESDIKTIIMPSLMFALFTAPALPAFGISTPPLSIFWRRVPTTLLWIYINILPFNIDNQRQLDSIAEDRVNKPWRTMPSQRMTPGQAKSMMLFLYPVAFAASQSVGGTEQCVSLMMLGYWYNNLKGSDANCVVRNLINAAGFNRFTTGALEVMLGGTNQVSPTHGLSLWYSVIAAIVATTVQTQDMYDQEGDAARGRRTVPLVLGDANARWVTAITMIFWTVFCPLYIGTSLLGASMCLVLGLTIAYRLVLFRTVPADRKTFWFWNMWIVSIYLLPLIQTASRAALVV